MGVQLHVILTACIVNFALTSNPTYVQVIPRLSVQDQSEVRENFQYLFNSIADNNAAKDGRYRGVLEDKVMRERKTFDAINEEFQILRHLKNDANRRNNAHKKVGADENVIAIKRETREWYKNTKKSGPCPVDTQYMKFHSAHLEEMATKPWSLANGLTAKTLKLVCDEVLADNPPPYRPLGEFDYIDPPKNGSLQTERVVKNAAVVCSKGIAVVPLIYCSYNGTDFYLAEGNETHVFRLVKDEYDDLYYFQSGAHVIHYNNNNS